MTDRSYKAMSRLYDRYSPEGFTILAFPCNQFLYQEPGSAAAIKEFAQGTYGARFPLFDKISVRGPDQHPVYRYLLHHLPGAVPWNFGAKFFCNREGMPIKRFDASNNWDEIEQYIQAQLKTPSKL